MEGASDGSAALNLFPISIGSKLRSAAARKTGEIAVPILLSGICSASRLLTAAAD
jgi:hypothetical protein